MEAGFVKDGRLKALMAAFIGLMWVLCMTACGDEGDDGCSKDIDCKGERICQAGVCLFPGEGEDGDTGPDGEDDHSSSSAAMNCETYCRNWAACGGDFIYDPCMIDCRTWSDCYKQRDVPDTCLASKQEWDICIICSEWDMDACRQLWDDYYYNSCTVGQQDDMHHCFELTM